MANPKLSPAQVESLRPYEKNFGTAIRSGWSSPVSDAAVEKMRGVWLDLTGSNYPMNNGCGRCLMNLLKDVGTLYFESIGEDPHDSKHSTVIQINPQPKTKAPAQAKKTAKAKK